MKKERVAILGASDNPERYSFKAFEMLKEYGHTPVPVSPTLKNLAGLEVFPNLSNIKDAVDSLTMYVNSKISSALETEILALNPKRVIFNPGSENSELQKKLTAKGIKVEQACTLVLLRTGQF